MDFRQPRLRYLTLFFCDIWDLRRVEDDSHSWLFALRPGRFICENLSSTSLVFRSSSHHLHLLRTLLSTNSSPNFCFCFCLVFWRVFTSHPSSHSHSPCSASLQLYVLFSRFENTVKCVLKRMELFLFESRTFFQWPTSTRCRMSALGLRRRLSRRNGQTKQIPREKVSCHSWRNQDRRLIKVWTSAHANWIPNVHVRIVRSSE